MRRSDVMFMSAQRQSRFNNVTTQRLDSCGQVGT